jgi:hypothetical protein
MPSPWNAIPHVSIIYKHDGMGRICIFLPCMEQVHRSIAVLKTHGFKDIRTFECLLRPADVKRTELPIILETPSPSTSEIESPPLKRCRSTLFPSREYVTTKTMNEIRGHTSYLTFATYLVPEIK